MNLAHNLGPTSDRRLHQRNRLTFTYIELGADNAGTILDICEGGLRVQAMTALADDLVPRIRFQLLESRGWIDTKCRIAWTVDSQKLAGVEFVDLSDEALKEIRQLLSSASQASPLAGGTKMPELTEQDLDTRIMVDSPENRPTGASYQGQSQISARTNLHGSSYVFGETSRPVTRSSQRWVFVAGLGSFLLILLVIGASKTGTANKTIGKIDSSNDLTATQSEAVQGQHAVNEPVPDPRTRPETTSSVTSPDPPSTISLSSGHPLEDSGFGLQVAAMTKKDNADALVSSLHDKNVPVRVLNHASDSFYRVVVGPYGDKRLANDAKSELEAWGYKPILVPWKP